jgi:hypothetical protein
MKARAFWVPSGDGATRDLVLTFDPKFEEKNPDAEELSREFKTFPGMWDTPFGRLIKKVPAP